MGVLPGWWLGKADGRYPEPYISEERWDKELRAAGFNGNDAVAHDGYLNNNIIAMPSTPSPGSNRLTLLCVDQQAASVAKIEASLREKGYEVDYCTIDEIPPPQQDVLSLLDLDHPFLHDAGEAEFKAFVKFVHQVKETGLLWVTGACQVSCRDPKYALIHGVARVCRTEMSMDFGVLELESFNNDALNVVPNVFREFDARLHETDVDPTLEWAYAYGRVLISRYHFIDISEKMKSIEDPTAVRKLEMHRPGLASTLYWKQVENPPLGDNDVEFEVRAVGLNFKVSNFDN
jgi:hypothetical protein